jgi:hypothetical protein
VAGRGLRVHGGRVVKWRVSGHLLMMALYLAGVSVVAYVVARALGGVAGELAPLGGLR